MSDMADVILRTSRLDLQDSLALARELTAAGFGPVREAKAQAWDAAVASLVYPDGSKVEVAENTNPYRSTE